MSERDRERGSMREEKGEGNDSGEAGLPQAKSERWVDPSLDTHTHTLI